VVIADQAARRRITTAVAAIRIAASTISQLNSMTWNGPNRLPGC
jgi:hypothetical protein